MCMQTRGARWPECRAQRARLRPSGAHQPFSPDFTSCFSIAPSSCFTRPAFLSTVSHVTAATCGSSIFAYCAPLPTMQDTIFWSWVSRGQPRAPALALVARMIKPIGTWTRVKGCYGSKPTSTNIWSRTCSMTKFTSTQRAFSTTKIAQLMDGTRRKYTL
jgi:hypothetical protein